MRFLVDETENDTKKNVAKSLARHFPGNVTLAFWSDEQKFHAKFAVLDAATLLTGSVNWSKHSVQDGDNIDNMVVVRDAAGVAAAAASFEQLWADKRARVWKPNDDE